MSEELPNHVHLFVTDLLDAMEDLTPDQRTAIFYRLRDSYCEQCGDKQMHAGQCQCWNDE